MNTIQQQISEKIIELKKQPQTQKVKLEIQKLQQLLDKK
jgi:hypothetical protein